MRLTLLSAFLLSAATSAFADEGATGPSDVLELTAASFDKSVPSADLMLVEFFAPWCGHCKALAPHYEEAATALKAKNIPIAKVDCTAEAELCTKHGVTGYPTLKVFKNGSATDYNGPRKADGIISYMVKQSLPAVAPVTAENHEEFKAADKVVIVLYSSSTTDAPVAAFSKAAEKHRDDYLFGIASDAAAIQAAGVKSPSLVVYKKFDEGKDVYPDSKLSALTVEAVEGWLKDVATPVMDEVSGENYSFYAESGLPLAYLFLDPTSDNKDALLKEYKPLAKKFKGKLNFVWIDALKFAEHGKAMNLQEPKWPAFVVQDMEKQLKYPHSQKEALTVDSVDALLEQYLAGVLEPQLRSEAIPETQDEPVFVLVSKQFDEVVFDDSKDVLVEFYAPWCGHCKRLKPTWDELGEKFADVRDRLVIAKMDATENDIPPSAPFRVAGFPTIKFKAAGSKEFIDYEGDRSLESFVEFVQKNAKNDLTAKETTSASVPPVETVETVAQQDEHKQTHVEL